MGTIYPHGRIIPSVMLVKSVPWIGVVYAHVSGAVTAEEKQKGIESYHE